MTPNPIHESDAEEDTDPDLALDSTLYSVPMDPLEGSYDTGDALRGPPTSKPSLEWDESVYYVDHRGQPVSAEDCSAPRVAWPADVYEGQYERPCTDSEYSAGASPVVEPSYAASGQRFFDQQRVDAKESGQEKFQKSGNEYEYGFQFASSTL